MGAAKALARLCLIAAVIGAAIGASVAGAAEHAAKSADGKGGVSDWLGKDEAQFFQLPPFNIPVIRHGKLIKQVALSVTLETRNVNKRNKIIEKRQILRSAFLRDLYAVLPLQADHEPVNLETVKIRLKRIADRVLGKDVATDVLMETAYTRRLD